MELLREFTVGLVIVCIIGSVILILSPEGAIEKQVKTVVSLVTLLCFLYPFLQKKDIDVNFSFNTEDNITVNSEDYFADAFASKLESDIVDCLRKNGIITEKIEIDMHISEENEILIERVTVYVLSEYASETDKIKEIIKNNFGIICSAEVSYESQN